MAKHKHDLRHTLIGGEAQGCGGCGQGIGLAGTQIIRQGAILPAVHTIGDLIGAGEVIGSGDHSVQPYLGGDGIPPIETVQPDIGSIGDAGEGVAHRLAAHDLLGAGFCDGHAGSQALVCHFKADDLALMLQVGGELCLIDAIVVWGLDLPDGVAGQRELFGNRKAPAVGADGVHQIACPVVNLKDSPLQ